MPILEMLFLKLLNKEQNLEVCDATKAE